MSLHPLDVRDTINGMAPDQLPPLAWFRLSADGREARLAHTLTEGAVRRSAAACNPSSAALQIAIIVAGTCSLSDVVLTQTANDHEGSARRSFWIGVILSIVADAIIAVSLNVQKTAHMRNKVRLCTYARICWRWRRVALKIGVCQQAWTVSVVSVNGTPLVATQHCARHGCYRLRTAIRSFPPSQGPDGKPKKGYWRIPLWWLGLLLNMGGEIGNMLAYGFAPASVVAPVGSVGVFFNEVIAVVFLKVSRDHAQLQSPATRLAILHQSP
jgi:hypothetical protein